MLNSTKETSQTISCNNKNVGTGTGIIENENEFEPEILTCSVIADSVQ